MAEIQEISQYLLKKIRTGSMNESETKAFKQLLIDTRQSLSAKDFQSKLLNIGAIDQSIIDRWGPQAFMDAIVYIDRKNWKIYINSGAFPLEFHKYAAVHEAEEHTERTLASKHALDPIDKFHQMGLRAEYEAARRDGVLEKYQEWWQKYYEKQLPTARNILSTSSLNDLVRSQSMRYYIFQEISSKKS